MGNRNESEPPLSAEEPIPMPRLSAGPAPFEQTRVFNPSTNPRPNEGNPFLAGPASPLIGDDQATVAFRPGPHLGREEAFSQPSLEVIRGQANQKEMFLGREAVRIGRAKSNDLVLQDAKVSRSHAEVAFKEGNYYVQDLNSANGVYVDDQLIQSIILKPGNRITLGVSELLFKQKEPEITLDDKVAFLNGSDLFQWLDEAAKMSLARSLSVRFFPEGTTVFSRDTLLESMFFLYSGTIRIAEVNEEGGERIIDRLAPGDFFGERALLAGEASSYSMITNTDSILLELQKENLNALFLNNPELNKAFYRMVFKRLQTAQGKPDQAGRRKDNLKGIVTSTQVEIIGESKKILEAKK
ncbi:MAG: FHA domain-containing protein, partial [Desulfobacteraceae bacterium]